MSLIKLFNRLAFQFPKDSFAFLVDFKDALKLVHYKYNNSRHVNVENHEKIIYSLKQFQKVGGFVTIASVPIIGGIVGAFGIIFAPRNLLTYHFQTKDEEDDYMKLEYQMMQSNALKLQEMKLIMKCSKQTSNLHDLDNTELCHLVTSNNILMFGSDHMVKLFPSSFHKRWLEIKLIDTINNDHILRQVVENEFQNNNSHNYDLNDNNKHQSKMGVVGGVSKRKKVEILLSNLDERLIRRLAFRRGIYPLNDVDIKTVGTELIRWIYSSHSLAAFPPPPLSPNRLEMIVNYIFNVLKINSNNIGIFPYYYLHDYVHNNKNSIIKDNDINVDYDYQVNHDSNNTDNLSQTTAQATAQATAQDTWASITKHVIQFLFSPFTSAPMIVEMYHSYIQQKMQSSSKTAKSVTLDDYIDKGMHEMHVLEYLYKIADNAARGSGIHTDSTANNINGNNNSIKN